MTTLFTTFFIIATNNNALSLLLFPILISISITTSTIDVAADTTADVIRSYGKSIKQLDQACR